MTTGGRWWTCGSKNKGGSVARKVSLTGSLAAHAQSAGDLGPVGPATSEPTNLVINCCCCGFAYGHKISEAFQIR